MPGVIWHHPPEIPGAGMGQALKREAPRGEKREDGRDHHPELTQSRPSATRNGHGAATRIPHVFINKTASGEESPQKTVRLGLLLASEANPRWRDEPVGPGLGSAETNALPGALLACPGPSPPSGFPGETSKLLVPAGREAGECGGCRAAGGGIGDGAAGKMEKINPGSAAQPQPHPHREPGGEAGARS